MRQKLQNRVAEVGESVNMTSELGVSFEPGKKRECKRMGKRIWNQIIRIPHPYAAYACRDSDSGTRLRHADAAWRYANYMRLPMRLHSLFMNVVVPRNG